MQVNLSTSPLLESDLDLVCLGLFAGQEPPAELAGARGVDDIDTAFRKLTMLRPESPIRVLVVGLGDADDFNAERARVAAADAVRQAGRYKATKIGWIDPTDGSESGEILSGLIEGTVMASFRFDRFLSSESDEDAPPPGIAELTIEADSAHQPRADIALATGNAANRARELQVLPGNFATPTFLAERGLEIAAAHENVSAEIIEREQMKALGMGGMIAVTQGSAEPPKFIVLRYDGGDQAQSTLGIVGKAVSFDTGGISLKPGAGMPDMKMDMSGGAAALEATAAIAELGLAINVLCVVPSVENMPSSTAIKPGDVITHYNGKTSEILNTDAEGRLILADALAWAVEQGVDHVVDLATLTGAVTVALGSTYAGVVSNDDTIADAVLAAGERSGEIAWRLPLHPEFTKLMKGKITDLVNAGAKRKAGTITAAAYLEAFVGDTSWCHIDIAGTAWDNGRAYVGDGASGYGTRLLVDLARDLSS